MNGRCQSCDVEDQCAYPYKPTECCNYRKFRQRAPDPKRTEGDESLAAPVGIEWLENAVALKERLALACRTLGLGGTAQQYKDADEAFIAHLRQRVLPASVEAATVQLVEALVLSRGWLHGYADAVVRDAIERKEPEQPDSLHQIAPSAGRTDGSEGRDGAPWPDHFGQPIRHGDRLTHPDGTEFVAVKLMGHAEAGDAWRAVYDDASVSRLCLQIGDKGRAALAAATIPSTAPAKDAECATGCVHGDAPNDPECTCGSASPRAYNHAQSCPHSTPWNERAQKRLAAAGAKEDQHG